MLSHHLLPGTHRFSNKHQGMARVPGNRFLNFCYVADHQLLSFWRGPFLSICTICRTIWFFILGRPDKLHQIQKFKTFIRRSFNSISKTNIACRMIILMSLWLSVPDGRNPEPLPKNCNAREESQLNQRMIQFPPTIQKGKIDIPNLVAELNRTPKRHVLKESGLHAQNMLTTLDSTVNIIGRTCMII